MRKIVTYGLLALLFVIQNTDAQTLIASSELKIETKDGTELICYNPYSMSRNTRNSYYYLPTNIHFSTTKSGAKSYSLLVYKDGNEQVEGGIMHWLLTWGLTKDQRMEAERILKSKVGKDALLMGAVMAEKSTSYSFEIQGTNRLSKLLKIAIVSKGNTPLIPNSKIAIAFKFSKKQATSINNLFGNPNELQQCVVLMHFLVSFKKVNGKIYKRDITIKQNLQTILTH